MSAPGDPGRRQVIATDPVDVVAKTTELVGGIPGARTFELAYDAADRKLADGEEPGPDDRVRWTATAVIRRRYGKVREDISYAGTYVADAGQDQAIGGALACVDLLEKLGANAVVVDMTTDEDPRR